jgi:hypothetical protein
VGGNQSGAKLPQIHIHFASRFRETYSSPTSESLPCQSSVRGVGHSLAFLQTRIFMPVSGYGRLPPSFPFQNFLVNAETLT